MVIFKSPYPDIQIPETDLYSFLFEKPYARDVSPSQPALIDAATGNVITYGEFKERINRLANGLHKFHGIGSNSTVAIFSPNHVDYLVALFGAIRLGASVTTANPTYTYQELNFQLTDSGAVFLITIPELIEVVQKAAAGTKVRDIYVFGGVGTNSVKPLRSLEISGNPPSNIKIDTRQSASFLLYSSGTTGKPKGVENTHRNLISNILQISSIEPEYANEVWTVVLPMYHVYGLAAISCLALHRRIPLVVMAKFDLEQFLRVIQTYRISLAHIVPPIIIALAKHPVVDKFDLSSLRQIISGAAPLGKETEDECAKRLKVSVRQSYGMTELSPTSHLNPPAPKPHPPASIGYLVPNCEAKIVNPDTGKECGINEEGEIWIRGPNVMKGYLNRPDATAETIDKDGFLHTGDIGKVDQDGFYYITDRLKELIKVKGLQVAPAELESVILSHPAVADCAVIGIKDERAGEAPKGFVTLKAGIEASSKLAEEIMAFVEGKVAPHKKLKVLEFVAAIPKSPSGKILRRMLKDVTPSKL